MTAREKATASSPRPAENPPPSEVVQRYRNVLGATPKWDDIAGAGGFSGARLWRGTPSESVVSRITNFPPSRLVLRQWHAAHPGAERLAWIHAVLQHTAQGGCVTLAVPLAADDGRTFVEYQGRLWELSPCLEGSADFAAVPSDERLTAAMVALAEFHRAIASFPGCPPPATAPVVTRRLKLLDRLRSGVLDVALEPVNSGPGNDSAAAATTISIAYRLHGQEFESQLRLAARWQVAHQICLRDVHEAHVLFSGTRVTGIVDYGALAWDSVAADVARLAGGLAHVDRGRFHQAVIAYERTRSLTDYEHRLVEVLHTCDALLSGLQWLLWLFVDGMKFDDQKRVHQRLETLAQRVKAMT